MVTRHPAPALYFSVLGADSMAAKMSTGDFDGDTFIAIGDEPLLQHFKTLPESNFVPGFDGRPACEAVSDRKSTGSSLSCAESGQGARMRAPRSLPGLSSSSTSSTDMLAAAVAVALPEDIARPACIRAAGNAPPEGAMNSEIRPELIPDTQPVIIREPHWSQEETTAAVLRSIKKQRRTAPVMTRAANLWQVRP